MPILARGLPGLIVVALTVFCVFDVIKTDESRIQNLPKIIWLFVIVFIPLIGPLAWLLLGRPSNAELRPGGTRPRTQAPPPPPTGLPQRPPISSEDHNAKRDERLKKYYEEREQEIKQREEELRRREAEFRKRELGDDG
jgi:hypothetical protein